MADMLLPLDILILIMEVSPRVAVARMTRTCRALYHGGAMALLRDSVKLSTDPSIISFLKYMLSDAETRFRHLRALEISGGRFSRRAVDALEGLISHPLLALVSLTLRDAEAILSSDPNTLPGHWNDSGSSLSEAFSRIRTLRSLTIDGCDELALALVAELRSPLISVFLGLVPLTPWNHSDHPDQRNPIVLLTSISETLEELRGTDFDIFPTYIKYDVVYPAVRRIEGTYVSAWMPGTMAYINSFPNLEYLSLTSPLNRTGFRTPDVHRHLDLAASRSSNKGDQEKYRRTWEHLREVEGSLMDIFVLGLGCQVPVLRVLGDISSNSRGFFEDVLSDVRPSTLAMTVVGAFLFEQDAFLSGALKLPTVQHLQNLKMELCFAPSEGDTSIEDVITNLTNTLTPLPLRELTITLNYGVLTAPYTPSFEYFCPLEREAENLDLGSCADRFVEAIPSLTRVSFHLSKDRRSHEYLLGAVGGDADSVSSRLSGSESEGSNPRDDADQAFADFMNEEDDDGW